MAQERVAMELPVPVVSPAEAEEEDAEYDEREEEADAFLVHNLAEQGRVERLRALLPPRGQAGVSRLAVLASESSLLDKDDMGFLPLHTAVLHQQEACALHLLRYSPALTCAMLRLKGGDLNTPFLHLLLRVGAVNPQFSTLLVSELFSEPRDGHEDAYGGDVRALLLDKLTLRDEEHNTVFHLCARYDLVACLDLLAAFYLRHTAAREQEQQEAPRASGRRSLSLQTLLDKGNKLGARALHEAMKYKAAETARRLVTHYHVSVNCATSLQQTPAHVAALAGFAQGVTLLRDAAADWTRRDSQGHTAAHVAHRCGFSRLEKAITAAAAGQDAPECAEEPSRPAETHTRFLFHREAWHHLAMARHRRGGSELPPENPERLAALVDPVVGILRSREFQRPDIHWDHDIPRADVADVLRVHEFTYVDRVRRRCAALAGHGDAHEGRATAALDLDTALSARSYDAAMRAAGAVCKAVEDVVAGKCRNAFCIVRPPGHHAGPVGKVPCANDPEGSLGFCLVNNVAVGAAYARAHLQHRGVHKVAILDFDVHHGNGTEEIVRQLEPRTAECAFETPYGAGKQIVQQYKPWRSEDDAQHVFFASVHGYGHKDDSVRSEQQADDQPWFYPGSGESSSQHGDATAPRIWNVGLPVCPQGSAPSRLQWRSAFRDRILPELRAFGPDLIFLSAGFDAHKKELVNCGYVSLLEQDYEWLVAHVKRVANSCCHGRLISVLEGGYNCHGRLLSPFARSVAAHARALANPAQELWDEHAIAKEAAHEHELLARYLAPAPPVVTLQPSKKKRSGGGASDSNAAATEATVRGRSKRARKDVDYVALAKQLADHEHK